MAKRKEPAGEIRQLARYQVRPEALEKCLAAIHQFVAYVHPMSPVLSATTFGRSGTIRLDSSTSSSSGTQRRTGPHDGFRDRLAEFEARFSGWPRPALFSLRGSWLGSIEAGVLFSGNIRRLASDPRQVEDPYQGLRLQDLADALLYLGPFASLAKVGFPPSGAWNELRTGARPAPSPDR